MKSPRFSFLFLTAGAVVGWAADAAAPRKPDLIVLDEMAVQNLRLETVVAEATDFEETVFALGRIEVYPGRRAAISSRIAGRALEVPIKHDHAVQQGDVAVVVESRQFGEPPPVVRLTAPLAGLVSVVRVVPGQPVSPDEILAEVLDLSEVYAVARVPDHLAAKLKRGQLARIRVAAVADKVFEAPLEHLGALADPETGTVEAAFHVENPGTLLRPGMRAEFSIVVGKRTGVVSVPRRALQGDPAGRFVYVKDFSVPHAFVKAPVVVGEMNERAVEIVRGLFPADEVVTQGAYSLAFAGGGTVSLKAALDAAHGHEHNADGSELTPDQRTSAGKKGAAPGTGHAHGHEHEHGDAADLFWKILSGVLFVLLLVVGFRKGPPRDAAGASTGPDLKA